MKKEIKIGEWVNIDMEVVSINYDHYLLTRSGVNIKVLKDQVKHTEPEFTPREMLVWERKGQEPRNRKVIGIFKDKFIAEAEGNTDDLVVWNYAKEIPKELESVSDEELLKTFEAWLKQIKK